MIQIVLGVPFAVWSEVDRNCVSRYCLTVGETTASILTDLLSATIVRQSENHLSTHAGPGAAQGEAHDSHGQVCAGD